MVVLHELHLLTYMLMGLNILDPRPKKGGSACIDTQMLIN
jgi:hypothetical protein